MNHPEQELHPLTKQERFEALAHDVMHDFDVLTEEAEQLLSKIGGDVIPRDHPEAEQLWKRAESAYRSARRELHLKHGAIDEPTFDELDDYLEHLKKVLEEDCGRVFLEQSGE